MTRRATVEVFDPASTRHILTGSESVSELLYDWRFTVNQFVFAPSPLRLTAGIYFSQMNTCGSSLHITSSLTRGLGCHLQLLLALASTLTLGSVSRGTRDHILLSQIQDFLPPPTTRRATVEVFDPAPTRELTRSPQLFPYNLFARTE
jgi:hypothetical protein